MRLVERHPPRWDKAATGAAAGRWPRWRPYLFPAAVVAVAVAFLVAPGAFEHKAHVALHGLCAQRPSHTIRLGGLPLPFDARMTGIYGGCLIASAYLAVRGRYRAWELPDRPTIVLLALFVGAMAIDGTNSLLLDLGLWHPYPPGNGLRLLTGLLTGVALATTLCVLLATTLWRTGDWDQATIAGPAELALIVALQAPFALAAWSGLGALYVPLSAILLAGATGVMAAMMLVVVVLLRRADRSFDSPADLTIPATVGLLLGLATMAGLAGGRFLLERMTGPLPLT